MQLSQYQAEAILAAVSELDYGKVTVTVAETNRVVDIVTERRQRVHHTEAEPTQGKPVDRVKNGRY